MSCKPNLFIVGAPKCGTTALAQYLGEHSDVFMSDPKEPHFLAADLPDHHKVKSKEAYLRLFKSSSDAQIIGEASVWYLYSQEAIRTIKAFNEKAKLIVMLRNPVDLLYSMHSQHIYSRNEQFDFATAWAFCDARRRGEQILKTARDGGMVLQYDQIAKLGEQLQRLYAVFPREQIKLIFFEDFKADTKGVFEDVLEFLHLNSEGRTEFERINANKQQKYSWLANFTERPPEVLIGALASFKKIVGIKGRLNLLEPFRKVNDAEVERLPLSEALRAEIITVYKDDIKLLAQLTERDLSHWLGEDSEVKDSSAALV